MRIKRGPEASIIILTWNQKKFLEKSLPVIFKQTFKNFEVIVIDSGSTDGAIELMKKYPVKIIPYQGPTGNKFNFARAFNLGARKAGGRFLIKLSGDVIPGDKGWLESLVKSYSDPKIAGVYGKEVLGPDANFLHKIRNFFTSSFFQTAFSKLSLGTLFYGACCSVKKKLWEEVPFDESLPFAEDANWSLEMKKRGYRTVFSPGAFFYHSHPNREIFTPNFWISTRELIVLYWKALILATSGKDFL